MRQSVLQLRGVQFVRIHIDIDSEFNGNADEFEFENARFRCEVVYGHRNSGPLEYWVGVEYGLRSSDEKRCPYIVDIKAVGFIDCNESVPSEKRDELVFENGAALVFGAIREQVATLTGRSLYGMLTLPTHTFIGSYAEHARKQVPPADSAKQPAE